MICEYCGSNIRVVPDNGVCPNCGGVLPQKMEGVLALDSYFQRFQPNRVKAIKALRADTGMGLAEAKTLIDRYFDEQLGVPKQDLAAAGKNLRNAIKAVLTKR